MWVFFVSFLLSEGVCIYNKISALFNNRYECRAFTTLPHNLIKEKLGDLTGTSKSSTKMKVHFILLVTIGKRFSLLQTIETLWYCQNSCDALSYI